MRRYIVTYMVELLDGRECERVFNTHAKRRLSMRELYSRAKKHCEQNSGTFLSLADVKKR